MKLTKEQKQEIADQQAQKNATKRVTSSELIYWFRLFKRFCLFHW